jgi:hypothetical protein
MSFAGGQKPEVDQINIQINKGPRMSRQNTLIKEPKSALPGGTPNKGRKGMRRQSSYVSGGKWMNKMHDMR